MIDLVDILRWLHVIGAAVLFGTGAGIAFFMLIAHRTRDPALIAHVGGTVVFADTLFTATAVVVQPITGAWMAFLLGWSLWDRWIVLSLALYVFTGLCWLPVVWLQLRMRDLAVKARDTGTGLPNQYFRYWRWWFALGFPAFTAVSVIFWLMLVKPELTI